MMRSDPSTGFSSSRRLFGDTKLPCFSELAFYSINPDLQKEIPILPEIPVQSGVPRKRGAPTKLRNEMINRFQLRNTSGKTFKFSFVPQILVSHLHHLFNLKKKSRYQRDRWVRSYTPEGVSIQKEIFEMVGEQIQVLDFKRTVSMKELRDWLDGEIYSSDLSQEFTSAIRMKVFRLFCILKTIDLKKHFALDFSLEEQSERVYLLVRRYLCHYMWEELRLPEITEEEIQLTVISAIKKHPSI